MKKTIKTIFAVAGIMGIVLLARYFYQKPGIVNGDEAPLINGMSHQGNGVDLISLRESYVLIDFWGSWCGPCRKANADIRSLYEEYHDKQFIDGRHFHVFSIGIETDSAAWIQAIESDRLFWAHHISTMNRFDSEWAKAYGVRNIPATFLVDPRGIVIGVNSSDMEIRNILNKRLKYD
ncbi:MAG: TlpA family protein disulfide reductase [Saprospiraceae bacterium]|jgi:thiol-disulfide isomerase/thioredoxin|nr:TlpA family protein disulfide reductase [Saprospiraceae bacterium]